MDTSLLLIAAFLWDLAVLYQRQIFGYTLSDTLGQPVLCRCASWTFNWTGGARFNDWGIFRVNVFRNHLSRRYCSTCASSAALVAIPIALRTGLDAHAATVLAVPFGILGSILWN